MYSTHGTVRQRFCRYYFCSHLRAACAQGHVHSNMKFFLIFLNQFKVRFPQTNFHLYVIHTVHFEQSVSLNSSRCNSLCSFSSYCVFSSPPVIPCASTRKGGRARRPTAVKISHVWQVNARQSCPLFRHRAASAAVNPAIAIRTAADF